MMDKNTLRRLAGITTVEESISSKEYTPSAQSTEIRHLAGLTTTSQLDEKATMTKDMMMSKTITMTMSKDMEMPSGMSLMMMPKNMMPKDPMSKDMMSKMMMVIMPKEMKMSKDMVMMMMTKEMKMSMMKMMMSEGKMSKDMVDDNMVMDDMPAIINKIAKSMAKKFGFGSPDQDGPDVEAAEEMLMKVYDAGCKDGEKSSKKIVKESANLLPSFQVDGVNNVGPIAVELANKNVEAFLVKGLGGNGHEYFFHFKNEEDMKKGYEIAKQIGGAVPPQPTHSNAPATTTNDQTSDPAATAKQRLMGLHNNF